MSGRFLEVLAAAIARQGYATVALPGGRTPVFLFAELCRAKVSGIWEKTHVFFGDERCLPLWHPDSNYGLAQRHLLSQLPVAVGRVLPMPGEVRPLAEAARRYQTAMRDAFESLAGRRLAPDEYPAFDLICLGMGDDGHTASLFPGHSALASTDWVAAVASDQARPPVPRLTLTLPLLNRAGTVMFLVSGAAKLRLAEFLLSGPPDGRYPASLVRPAGCLIWYLAP